MSFSGTRTRSRFPTGTGAGNSWELRWVRLSTPNVTRDTRPSGKTSLSRTATNATGLSTASASVTAG